MFSLQISLCISHLSTVHDPVGSPNCGSECFIRTKLNQRNSVVILEVSLAFRLMEKYRRIECTNIAPPIEVHPSTWQTEAKEYDNKRNCQAAIAPSARDVIVL
jgi:hypothetical protein